MNKTRIGVDDLSLRPSPNSILAAAVTAHALDVARRKASKEAPRHDPTAPRPVHARPLSLADEPHESLFHFVLRLARLVAGQIRDRERKRRA